MSQVHVESVGSSNRVCEKCGEEKPLSEFPLVKRSKPWRRKSCIPCGRAYWNGWAAQNQDRVKTHRKATYERQRDSYRILGKSTSDPAKLDAIRRALVESPPTIDDDSAAVAYFRGYLAGAGRAKKESDEIEEYKDLVFRVAAEMSGRASSLPPNRRISYEDMVSAAYEGLLDCLRRSRRERPYIAQAIRNRIVEETRKVTGRADQGYRPNVYTNLQDGGDEGDLDFFANMEAEDERDDAMDLLAPALAQIPDERTRDVVVRRARGETFAEIGRAYGFTESRACQLFNEVRPLLEATLLQSTP